MIDHPTQNATDTKGWRWTPGRIAGIALTIGIAGFWIWAFSPLPERGNPDRMSDRSFPVAAEAVCSDARAAVDSLAPATSVESLEQRAALVDEGTTVLRDMIVALRTLEVDNSEEAGWVAAWLDDYDVYVADRDRFATALRSGDDGAPSFTVRGVEGVQTLIFGFAKVNEMDSCATPGDV